MLIPTLPFKCSMLEELSITSAQVCSHRLAKRKKERVCLTSSLLITVSTVTATAYWAFLDTLHHCCNTGGKTGALIRYSCAFSCPFAMRNCYKTVYSFILHPTA